MQLFNARQILFTLFLLLFSITAAAANKHYNVTGPGGVQIAVQESGNPNGQPIIFIHGLLGSHLNWEKQLQDKQLQSYRLITFDLRGHGISDKPQQEAAYLDGKLWAGDLAAVIEASKANKPLLVGWSLGGAVITNYLAAYTDAGLSGVLYVDAVVELVEGQIPAHPDEYRDMVSDHLKTHLDGQRAFLRLCFYKQPDNDTFERLLANAALVSWPMQRAVPSMSIPLEKGLKNVGVPMLFIYGKHDVLVNPQASLARALSVNPNIQSLMYEHSGHTPFIEETERFNHDLHVFAQSL